MWYTHTHTNRILLSHRKEWNNAIYSNMDGPRDYHTKWSKSEKERQISSITYMWNLNITHMNLFTEQKQTHRHKRQTYGYQRENAGGETGWEFGLVDANYYV